MILEREKIFRTSFCQSKKDDPLENGGEDFRVRRVRNELENERRQQKDLEQLIRDFNKVFEKKQDICSLMTISVTNMILTKIDERCVII